ncbi:MAG: hypothetical protein KAS62_01510 [Candidatus Delongbacteria bacterium]|nr:hypothetical protein [Candidatus Delongbacteria bacterium]
MYNSSPIDINNITTELIELNGSNIDISSPIPATIISAGNYIDIEYTCIVSNFIRTPSDTNLRLEFKSSDGIDTYYDLMLRVGMTEDFETGDLSQNEWFIWGDSDWYIDDTISYEGKYSLRSGKFGEGVPQYSKVGMELNSLTDGYISFYRKISTVEFDQFLFAIDGAELS